MTTPHQLALRCLRLAAAIALLVAAVAAASGDSSEASLVDHSAAATQQAITGQHGADLVQVNGPLSSCVETSCAVAIATSSASAPSTTTQNTSATTELPVAIQAARGRTNSVVQQASIASNRLPSAIFIRHPDGVSTTTPDAGWSSAVTVSPSPVNAGQVVTIIASIGRGGPAANVIVDLEIHSPGGTKVAQKFFENQAFAPNQTRYVVWEYTPPPSTTTGIYSLKVGVFAPNWTSNLHWNGAAASLSISGATTTTAPPTSTTSPTSTTTPPGARFNTLPPGSLLPTESQCATRVRPAVEVRAANATANATRGVSANDRYPRVTGNFAGTTDEIIQWAACKWGIDEDIVRAQMAKESWWFQRGLGDWTTNPSACAPLHPIGADGRPGECPESVGLSQVRWLYHSEAFENNNALLSTAYNIDYAYAVWRDCFEGNLTWLNTVERGATYAAGDAWGCTGVWFSGRWYTAGALTYIAAVQDYMNTRIWTQSYFVSAT